MTPTPSPRTVVILGVPFHDLTLDETVTEIARLIARREPCYLATANLDFAAQASHDVELQRILLEAELVLCDGKPLVWASRQVGIPLRERVTGSDLVPRLAAEAATRKWNLFLLGGDSDALETAMNNLRERYPGLTVAGYSPPFASLLEMEHDQIATRIKAARPDILLVAFGCPKQEKWIYMNYRRLGVPVSIGVGATVDFIAGKFRRAPRWMQVVGAEWVFRLLQEPRRLFNRYWFDLVFFVRAIRAERHSRRALAAAAASPSTYVPVPQSTALPVIAWPATVDAGVIQAGGVPTLGPTGPGQVLVLDLSGVSFIDSSGLGLIVKAFRQLTQQGGGLVLLRPAPTVRNLLATVRLDRVIPMVEDPSDARRALGLRPAAGAAAHAPETVQLTLTGDLTARSVPSTVRWIEDSWTAQPAGRLLQLDLRAVNFADSSGLGLFVRAHRLVQQRPGSSLILAGANPNVRNVIRIARLEAMFKFDDPRS